EKFNYIYVDTGAMYRALTYKALLQGVNVSDELALKQLLEITAIELQPSEIGQLVYVDGENVTSEIRNNEVTSTVSEVSKHRLVREEMVRRQQELGRSGGVVMDGRDIGTHVLPDAEVKVFLIASVDERAHRRYQENMQKGFSADIEKLKEEIALRDKLDSEREVSPLKKAADAIEIDTTSLTIEQVAEKIIVLIEERKERA
ncbi:(d)CMP kinase, partial [Peribacillus psychrosaccharolyticus]